MSDIAHTVNRQIFTAKEIVDALYGGLLNREPDFDGFECHLDSLRKRGVLPVISGLRRISRV